MYNNTPYNKLLNYTSNFPDTLQSLESKYSIQTYIPPDTETYSLHDYNKCYASEGTTPSLNMKPVDNNLHSLDDCINIAAAKQMSFNADFMNSFTTESQGLNFKIIQNYLNEPNTYNNATPITTGITTNLSNFNNAINNLTGINGAFSVEWQGFFIPNNSGLWTFSISSNTNYTCLWIGDVAINNYNVNNANINTLINTSYSGQFTAGNPYKIRIQFANTTNTSTFSLSILNTNNEITHGDNYLVTSLTNKNMVYFALVENTPQDTAKGLFKCYVTDTTQKNITQQLNAENSGFNLTTIWQLFDPNGPQTTQDGTLLFSESNYLYNNGSILGVYSGNGLLLRNLGQINPGDTVYIGGNHGDIFIGNVNVTNNSNTITAVQNPLFLKTYNGYLQNKNIHLDVIATGEKILCLPEYFVNEMLNYSNINNYIRISNDGCFIMFFTLGNLMISTNNSPCISYNQAKYTLSSSNSFYPYSVDLQNSNTNANVSYLVSEENKKKNPISEAVLGSNIQTVANYSSYDNYVPPNNNNTIQTNQSTCKNMCDNNPMCNYYYTYKTNDGNNYCSYDNNYSVPSYTKIQPNSNITNSSLNVKHFNILTDNISDPMKKNVIQNIPRKIITDSSILDEYQMDSSLTFDDIYNKLTGDYYLAIKLVNSMTLGTDPSVLDQQNQQLTNLLSRINTTTSQMENFTTYKGVKEGYADMDYANTHGFNTNDYKMGETTGAEVVTKDGLIKQVVDNKINPLIQTADDYSNTLTKINNNYKDITTNVKNINTIRNYLSRNEKYDFSGNMLMGDTYDSSGNLVKFNKYSPSIEDAVIEDTNTMMYRENTLYILGSITAASLIIAAITIAR